MQKQVLFTKKQSRLRVLAAVTVLGFGATTILVGNPVNKDAWEHQFTFPRRFSLYVYPVHYPLQFGIIHVKTGGAADIGRVEFVW